MQVSSKTIKDGSIIASSIAPDAVTTTKVQNAAIDGNKIANAVVDSQHFVAGGIDNTHLSTDAKQGVLASKLMFAANQIGDLAAGSSTSKDVTNEVLNIANTKKFGGDASNKGILSSSPINKAHLRDSGTQDPLQDGSSRQVYGRITSNPTAGPGNATFANGSTTVVGDGSALFQSYRAVGDWIKLDSSGVYGKIASIESETSLTLTAPYAGSSGSGAYSIAAATLSYYVDIAGTETAHTMAGETIDVLFPESYDLQDLPATAAINGVAFAEALPATHTHDDRYYTESEITTQLAQKRYEPKTIATQNVIPALSYTPRLNTSVVMFVDGIAQKYGSSYDYTVSGTAVTWNAGNAGFNIDPGDEVAFLYDSSN